MNTCIFGSFPLVLILPFFPVYNIQHTGARINCLSRKFNLDQLSGNCEYVERKISDVSKILVFSAKIQTTCSKFSYEQYLLYKN